MNGFYNDFSDVIIETPEERQNKLKKQRRLFSRVFLALFVYILSSYLVAYGSYAIAAAILSAEKYQSFAESSIWSVIISCVSQYFVAFPIFLLMLLGTPKAQNKERKKLSLGEFIIFFFMGQALMSAGNIIGNFINSIFGGLMGRMPENGIAATIEQTPMWLIFIFMVILAPIVEELIFRKLLIDRLSVYGDRMAIIFSAAAFGLMHGNLYQFFYAALLGALLGYVYTVTRDVRYTILMHMIINLFGSVIALPVQEYMLEFFEILTAMQYGVPINVFKLLICVSVMIVYSSLQYGMIIGGVIALVHYARKKKIVISSDKDIFLPDREIAKQGVINVGAILFILISLFLMVLNLFTA